MRKQTICAAVQLALVDMCAPAFADDAPAAADSAAEQAGRPQELQVVTVTATKRRENVQKIAASIGAVSGDDLAQRNLNTTADIQQAVPSITFTDTGIGNLSALSIRGVGTQAYSDAIEASVGMVVDGVVLGRTFQGVGAMYDVERVEVLRGPQGTLFGKNSSAGVLNIVTRDPGKSLEGEASLGTGSYGLLKANAALSVPLKQDVLALRIAAFSQERDGYIHNIATGHDLSADRQKGMRIKTLLTPNADRKIALSVDYQDQHGTADIAPSVVTQIAGQDLRNLGVTYLSGIAGPENALVNTSREPTNAARSYGGSVQWDENLAGGFTLTSITAYREAFSYDSIGGAVPNDPMLTNTNQLKLHQASEELRLASPVGETFDYVTGLYLWRSGIRSNQDQIADLWALSKAVPVRGLVYGRVLATSGTDTRNAAVFGQANYRFDKQWSMVLGARYTHENTGVDTVNGPLGSYTPAVGGAVRNYTPVSRPLGHMADQASTQRGSWQFSLRDELSKEVMAYATVSQGFKGAGFNTVSTTGSLEKVNPEIATSFEAGLKSRLLQNRVKVNLSAFLTDYKDFQASANIVPQGGGIPILTLVNAGKMRTKGLEWDIDALLAESLRLGFNGAYVDAHFLSFPKGPCTASEIVNGQCPTGAKELAGGVLQGNPKLSYNVSLRKEIVLDDMPFNAEVRGDYSWRDKVQWAVSQDPLSVSPSYGLLGMSVTLNDHKDRWALSLYGKNLNNAFHSRLQAWPLWGSSVRQYVPADYQRIWGVNASYRF